MKNLKILTIIWVLLAFTSCKFEEHANKNPYLSRIYSWSGTIINDEFKDLPDYLENNFYLLWDQNYTCQTCTAPLIEILKEFPEVVLVRNFEREEDIEFFKSAYKLENRIHQVQFPDNFKFDIPFAFKFEEVKNEKIRYTIRKIFILNEEYMNVSDFKTYLIKNKAGVYLEYHPKDWFLDWLSRNL